MDDLDFRPLGDLALNFDARRRPLSSRERAVRRGSFPYYGATGEMDRIDNFLFEGLHLLVAEDGSCETDDGRPYLQLVNGQFWVNNHAHVLRATSDADTRYLYYALSTVAIRPYLSGSVQAKLSQANLNRIPIPYFSRASTRFAIAEVLGALDDKIEANRRLAKRFEALAQSLVALHPPSMSVGDLAAIQRQMVSPKSFDGRDVEYFTFQAFDAHGLPDVAAASTIKSSKFLLDSSSVLLAKLNPHIPRVWMAELSGKRPALTSTEFVVLVPRGDAAVEILWAICSESRFWAQLVEKVKGTTSSHQRVAPEDVLNLDVPDPGTFSDATSDTVAGAVRLAVALKRESSALVAMRDALLPELLSGALRVREAQELVEAGL